jgi:hypothetical protein
MDFYLDENLPKRVARALNELEGEKAIHKVLSTEVEFGKGIKDPDLFQKLKEVEGILITNDIRISTRQSEFSLLNDLKISAFLITFPKNSGYWEKALKIINTWNLIKEITEKNSSHIIVKIKNNGTFDYL